MFVVGLNHRVRDLTCNYENYPAGLEKVWDKKPLFDGKKVMSLLGLTKGGPQVKEWVPFLSHFYIHLFLCFSFSILSHTLISMVYVYFSSSL